MATEDAQLNSSRKALDIKIWSAGISRNVTIYNEASTQTDDYGDEYSTFDSGTISRAVPYNQFSYQRDFLRWGTLGDGETEIAFPYTATITKGSKVVDNNDNPKTYEVMDIEPYPFGNGVLAYVARLKEKLVN